MDLLAWEWLHDEARDHATRFHYDPQTGKIQSHEEQALEVSIANWEY
jgi:hypothetical protein